jgi:hypothetical protein
MKIFSTKVGLIVGSINTLLISSVLTYANAPSSALEKYLSKLESIQTLSIEASADVQIVDKMQANAEASSGSKSYKYTYILKYYDSYFMYDVRMHDGSKYTYNKVEGRNSDGYFLFDRISRYLTVSKKPFVNALVMQHGHVAFLPFAFTQAHLETNPLKQLSLDDLRARESWKKTILLLKNLPNYDQGELVEIGKSLQINSKDTYEHYFVQFSPQEGLPVLWKKRLKNGVSIVDYEVNQWAEDTTGFKYPNKSRLTYYESDKIWYNVNMYVNSLLINKNIDINDFIVDPSEASIIRDLDQKVYIKVPK